MSALPPKADIEMGAALRLLVTQSGRLFGDVIDEDETAAINPKFASGHSNTRKGPFVQP